MDARRLKDEAAAHYLKGNLDRAVRTYALVIKLEPLDARLRLRYAEVCRRAKAPLAAVAAYREASRLFAEQGQVTCAHAALKMAVELAPGDPQLRDELAALDARPRPAPRDASSPFG